jgi:hypothetical protein
MKLRRFRALVAIDAMQSPSDKSFHSGTRGLLVHVYRAGSPATQKYFEAIMSWDDEKDLLPGDHAVVTLTVGDDEAPGYLSAGQEFTLWGAGTGHGVISRQVFTDGAPS